MLILPFFAACIKFSFFFILKKGKAKIELLWKEMGEKKRVIMVIINHPNWFRISVLGVESIRFIGRATIESNKSSQITKEIDEITGIKKSSINRRIQPKK